MVVPAFGFGLGDILGAIELIASIAKALGETDGAASQYQQAALELKALESVLRRVQGLEPTSQNSDLVRLIQLCSHTCHVPIATFFQRVERFEAQLGPGSSTSKSPTSKLRRCGEKINWAIFVEKELTKLKASILTQLTIIHVLLQLESAEAMVQLKGVSDTTLDCVKELLTSSKRLEDLIKSQVATLDQVGTLQPLLQDIFRHQVSHFEALNNYVENANHSIQDLLREFASQKKVIDVLQHDTRLLLEQPHDLRTKPPKLRSQTLVADPLNISTTSMGGNQAKPTITEALALLFQAVRRVISEFIVIIFRFMPALQRFIKTFSAISRAPTMLLQDNIHLEDALGRSLSLPFQQFRHLSVLRELLRCEFKGCPGEDLVKQGKFSLCLRLSATRDLPIMDDENPRIRRGSRIVMSIRSHMVLVGPNNWRTCPRCTHTSNVSQAPTWIRCQKCELIFSAMAIPRTSSAYLTELSDTSSDRAPNGAPDTDVEMRANMANQVAKTTDREMLDLQHFRRVHFFVAIFDNVHSRTTQIIGQMSDDNEILRILRAQK